MKTLDDVIWFMCLAFCLIMLANILVRTFDMEIITVNLPARVLYFEPTSNRFNGYDVYKCRSNLFLLRSIVAPHNYIAELYCEYGEMVFCSDSVCNTPQKAIDDLFFNIFS